MWTPSHIAQAMKPPLIASMLRILAHSLRRPCSAYHDLMPLSGEYEPGAFERSRKQVELYEATDGREGADNRGQPVIILTSVGAITGKLRKVALMRVEHGGAYAVVASLGGAPKHPAWYRNLKVNPHVELQDGRVKRDYEACEVFDDEKALWWSRAVEVWPDYDLYQARTDRAIPVFVLRQMF